MIYFIILFVILGAAIGIKPEQQKDKKGLLIVIVAFVCLVCGLRDMLGGYDNYIYGEIFDSTAQDIRMGYPLPMWTAFSWEHSEQLYSVWTVLVAFFTTNRYIFLLITAVAFYTLLYRHLIKYSDYPFIALFIFLCLYYFFTFTYLRQILAISISWFAIPYAIERKPIPFFVITALGTLMHSGAVMFVLLYPIANRRFTRNQYIGFFVIAFLVGLTPIGSFLVSTLGGEINEAKAEETATGNGDARLDYILEAGFFMWYFINNYRRIGHSHYSTCMMNIAFLFILMLLMFVRFENGGRLAWVFMIGIACWVAEGIAHTRKTDMAKIAMYGMMCLLYLRIINGWGELLNPYKTFLTNGVRYDDIWEKNEYDHRYDEDKLYKW